MSRTKPALLKSITASFSSIDVFRLREDYPLFQLYSADYFVVRNGTLLVSYTAFNGLFGLFALADSLNLYVGLSIDTTKSHKQKTVF